MQARAAVAWHRGAPWSIEEIELQPPGHDEVLVDWAASGMCHSDESMRQGNRIPPALESAMYPLVGGHEGAGVVAAVGPGVTEFAVGDHVLANFSPACGRCRYCASGRGFLCNENKGFMEKGQLESGAVTHLANGTALYLAGKLGTFADRTVVSKRSLVPIAPDLTFASVCLVACGVTTGWGSVVERGEARPGDVVVIVGLGGLGHGAVQGARAIGAAHIIGVEPNAHRRETAVKLGATYVGANIDEVREHVAHLTNGQGADVVVLTPSVVTGELIYQALGITGKGATCVVTGMGPIGVTDVPMDIGDLALFNKQLRGCLFGSTVPLTGMARLIELYRQGLLDLDSMVTTYPLEAIEEARADAHEGRTIRSVLTMNSHR